MQGRVMACRFRRPPPQPSSELGELAGGPCRPLPQSPMCRKRVGHWTGHSLLEGETRTFLLEHSCPQQGVLRRHQHPGPRTLGEMLILRPLSCPVWTVSPQGRWVNLWSSGGSQAGMVTGACSREGSWPPVSGRGKLLSPWPPPPSVIRGT